MTDVIPHVCNPMDVYDLDANEIALEIAHDTPLGEAIQCLREGEPLDASSFIHLSNAGVDFDLLAGAYL